MKRKNIHNLNKATSENLISMLNSPDEDSIDLGIEILKNLNLNDNETKKQTQKIIESVVVRYENPVQTLKLINIFSVFLNKNI